MKVEFYKNDYLCASSGYKDCDTVLFGIPYDGTCSYRPGSRFAPNAIRLASSGLEMYSVYQDRGLKDIKLHDAGNLLHPFGDLSTVLKNISEAVKGFLKDGKKIFVLGGEHLISYPIAKELIKKYPDMAVLHFDAHTDLRDEFFGEPLSHATVIKKIYELYPSKKDAKKSIFQFGIRSGTKEEFDFAEKNINICRYNLAGVKDAVAKIKNRPVYLTFDIDVFDPSVLPGTGTPEPGGVSFNDFTQLVKELKGVNIVCADVVELAPDYDTSNVSAVTAAKVVRELLLLMR